MDQHFMGQVCFGLLLIASMALALLNEHRVALQRQRRKERIMSRYAIYKVADELGVCHRTAMLIWDAAETPAEFRRMMEDYAAGRGFSLID